MIGLFLQFELGKIAKYFRTRTLAKVITTLLFIAVFLFVGAGIYFFFISGFRYINVEAVEDIRDALTVFIYEMFLLVLSGIIVFSATISGLFNLFRSEKNAWILASANYSIFPKIVFIRSLLSSAIPSLIMFIPAILAFTKIYSLGFLSVSVISMSLILVLITLNAFTLLSIIILASGYYKISRLYKRLTFSFGGLIILIFGIISILIALIWKTTSHIDLVHLFKADVASDTLLVETISEHFSMLPTHPLAMEILFWQQGSVLLALGSFLLLLLLACISSILWWKVSKLFYPLWQLFQEKTQGIKKYSEGDNPPSYSKNTPFAFTGGQTLALFKKEFLISSRNFKGVLWFFFLFSLWLAQVFTNFIISHNVQKYQLDLSQKTAILESLQCIIAVYFMSSFTLRFVFPSFSMEKKTAWILKSAPINFKKIFFGKYLFYSSFFVILGIVMSSITINILNITLSNALYSMILFILTTVCIVTFGLALGALFPNTETDDPEAISTSMPGLFFTATALIYGACGAFLLYSSLVHNRFFSLMVFFLITIVFIALLLTQTPRLVMRNQNNDTTL